VSCHFHTSVVSSPGKQPSVPTGYDAGYAPEVGLDAAENRKISASTGRQTPILRSCRQYSCPFLKFENIADNYDNTRRFFIEVSHEHKTLHCLLTSS